MRCGNPACPDEYVGDGFAMANHRAASIEEACRQFRPVPLVTAQAVEETPAVTEEPVAQTTESDDDEGETEDEDEAVSATHAKSNGNGSAPARTPTRRRKDSEFKLAAPQSRAGAPAHWEEPEPVRIAVSGTVDVKAMALYSFARADPDFAYEGPFLDFLVDVAIECFDNHYKRRVVVMDYSRVREDG